MRGMVAVIGVVVAIAAAHAEKPLLDRLTIDATGPVTVTVPLAEGPQKPVYMAADGSWKPLAVDPGAGRATFSLPTDVAGHTMVILVAPPWLQLGDTTPPAVEQLTVDGKGLPVAADTDLGHSSRPPGSVRILFHDAASPIDVGAGVVRLDGAPLPPAAITAVASTTGAETRSLEIALPAVDPGPHELVVRMPDAAPRANFAGVTLRYTTGPLLKDGGFEQLKADGTLAEWAAGMWSADANTKAEVKSAAGGHSGQRCAELTGTAGSLNLVLGQRVLLTAGRKYVVRGFYQAASPAGYLSMINEAKGENQQYLNSDRLKPVEAWTAFEWRFAAKPAPAYTLYLRNGAKGTVRFDDLVLEEE